MKQFFIGFSKWGLNLIKHFFPKGEKYIVLTLKDALKKGLNKTSVVYMYPAKEDLTVRKYCEENNIPVFLVEDGFIRSLTLVHLFLSLLL